MSANATVTADKLVAQNSSRAGHGSLRVIQLMILCWAGALSLLIPPSASAAEQYWEYSVRPGDTLLGLAEEYCTSSDHWRRIRQLNNLPADPDRALRPGTRLRFPLEILLHEPATSRVVQLHGSAQLIRAGSNVPVLLELGTALRTGDRVITGPDSNVTLHFADGSQLLILSDSNVLMDSLSAWSTTGMVDTRLRLQGGRVDTRVQPSRGPGSRYRITTPAAVAAVRGTKFRVAAESDAAIMRSEVTGGTVMVSGAGASLDVAAGYGLVSTAGQAPQSPRPLLPAPALGGNRMAQRTLPLRFTWPALDGARAYRLQIAPDTTFQTLLADRLVDRTQAEWPQLPDGEYALRVRGIDQAGLEGLDGVVTFRVDALPVAPALSLPPSGAVLRSATPDLSWQAQDGAHRYRVQLARNDTFSNVVVDSIVQEPNLLLSEPLQPGTWCWRVASLTTEGEQGPFGGVANFTYHAALSTPVPGEARIGDRQVAFDWQAVSGAQSYQLQVASDPAFNRVVHDDKVETTRAEMRRPDSQRYYYRVRAFDQQGEPGAFSATRQVDVPPRHYWPLLVLIPLLFL